MDPRSNRLDDKCPTDFLDSSQKGKEKIEFESGESKEESEKSTQQSEKKINAKFNPPKEFYCPITLEIMNEPVVASDGHTYEKAFIKEAYKINKNSPLTRIKLKLTDDFYPNLALKKMIDAHTDSGYFDPKRDIPEVAFEKEPYIDRLGCTYASKSQVPDESYFNHEYINHSYYKEIRHFTPPYLNIAIRNIGEDYKEYKEIISNERIKNTIKDELDKETINKLSIIDFLNLVVKTIIERNGTLPNLIAKKLLIITYGKKNKEARKLFAERLAYRLTVNEFAAFTASLLRQIPKPKDNIKLLSETDPYYLTADLLQVATKKIFFYYPPSHIKKSEEFNEKRDQYFTKILESRGNLFIDPTVLLSEVHFSKEYNCPYNKKKTDNLSERMNDFTYFINGETNHSIAKLLHHDKEQILKTEFFLTDVDTFEIVKKDIEKDKRIEIDRSQEGSSSVNFNDSTNELNFSNKMALLNESLKTNSEDEGLKEASDFVILNKPPHLSDFSLELSLINAAVKQLHKFNLLKSTNKNLALLFLDLLHKAVKSNEENKLKESIYDLTGTTIINNNLDAKRLFNVGVIKDLLNKLIGQPKVQELKNDINLLQIKELKNDINLLQIKKELKK